MLQARVHPVGRVSRQFSAFDNPPCQIWESCWCDYRSDYFALFIAASICALYGQTCVEQQMAHDEMLLHFTSLAMHMNASTVLQKARAMLHQLATASRLPCTLVNLMKSEEDTKIARRIDCVEDHPNGFKCPFSISIQ